MNTPVTPIKPKPKWMRIFGARFMRRWHAWNGVIYTHESAFTDEPRFRDAYKYTITHEQVHIDQQRQLGLVPFVVMYFGPAPLMAPAIIASVATARWQTLLWVTGVTVAMLPMSMGFACGRWLLERAAYKAQIDALIADEEYYAASRMRAIAVETLDKDCTWPAAAMHKWFKENT